MTDYRDGENYRLTLTGEGWEDEQGDTVVVVYSKENDRFSDIHALTSFWRGSEMTEDDYEFSVEPNICEEPNTIDPEHYQFPGGAQVIDISEHLTANSAQALQYIARSSRIDGRNKGNTIEDLTKAIWFLDREVDRLKEQNND